MFRSVLSRPTSLRSAAHTVLRTLPSSGTAFSSSPVGRDPSLDAETHFGFQTVRAKDKEKLVGEVFTRVAGTYDLMNDVLSVGVHRIWKDQMVHLLNPRPGIKHLDVAGGTGDISFRIIERLRSLPSRASFSSPIEAPATASAAAVPSPLGALSSSAGSVIVCDINQDMLDVGADRARKLGYSVVPSPFSDLSRPDATASAPAPEVSTSSISAAADCAEVAAGVAGRGDPLICFQQGDAADLWRFEDNSFDSYTIAFGLRNVTEMDKALREAHRVLRRGGRFMCLEFSSLDNVLLQKLYDEYSFKVMPALGQAVAGDAASYQYLAESIRQFPGKEELCVRMRDAGFKHVSYDSMTLGMVAIHSGYKA